MIQAVAIGNFLKNNKRTILYVLLGIVVLYVVYKIYEKLTENEYGQLELGDPLTMGFVPDNFDFESWCRRFEDEFIGPQFSYEGRNDLLEQMDQLNDNTLIALSNYWNDKYANKTSLLSLYQRYGTMPEILNNEWQPFATSGDTINYFSLMINKFNRLNIR